jgi:ATP-binding cassette subfamily F protein 3
MLFVENLTKGYGAQLLFEGAGFTVNPKERIGLVGRNGHGKTTLLRLIAGEDLPDEGTIACPKNYQIGYVHQHINFKENTVIKEGSRGLNQSEQDQQWKVEKILAGLGFSNRDMHRHPLEFSGGFQVRLNLAKVLVGEPDLLLLDEPTNYLDIASIRWVERFLLDWPRELILITHDRSFMDTVATHILGIHRKNIRKISGNTEKYYNQIARDEEIFEKTRINDERRQKEIELFINRFRAKARLANLVQSRVKTLKKREKKEKLKAIQSLEFSFRNKPFSGKRVLGAQNIFFSYESKTKLIHNFNLTIRPQERICIIGKNGKGKTTLLKLLAGQLLPQKGKIDYSPGVSIGFFEQTNVSHLVDTYTVVQEIMLSHPDVDRQLARNICGAMLFSGDEALKKIGVLSGGEKSRVMLGKLLAAPMNLLLLDEPTHHLDMESCDALLAAVAAFPGTVVMVTHNEMFLKALADRLVVFQEDRLELFEDGYQQFLDTVGWKDEQADLKPIFNDDDKTPLTKITKKDKRRLRSEIIAERSKAIKKIEDRIGELEKEIVANEEKLNELNKEMLEASMAMEGPRIEALSRSMHVCRTTVEKLFDELEKLSSTYDEQRTAFDMRIQQIEKS